MTTVFLGLDISALGFQALGASLVCTVDIMSADLTPHDIHVLNSGVLILKWTLIAQLIYIGIFILVILRFLAIHRGLQDGLEHIKTFLVILAWVAGISSALIMVCHK